MASGRLPKRGGHSTKPATNLRPDEPSDHQPTVQKILDRYSLLKIRLASFKIPKRVFFVPDLPRNSMGKVGKGELRQRYKRIFIY
jgi:acyl-CoA synthetase (AMP-forming)/AMP-acid ligase II